MRLLFLHPYPPDVAPSQRFRFEQYLSSLESIGYEYDRQSFWNLDSWRVLYLPGFFPNKMLGILIGFVRRFTLVFSLPKYDYVFIHREVSPIGPPIFEWIIARIFKKKIIYDFDDAIWLPNTSTQNRGVASLKWHQKVASICTWSYKISAGNDFLADYARRFNHRVIVNPTTIDLENIGKYHERPHYETPLTIGWTGTHSTLGYLDLLEPVLKELSLSLEFRFLVISNQNPRLDIANLEFRPWNKKTEIEDLLDIDVGVMPLPDTDWTRGKCGFKALQFMALGIPVVASPVGANRTIIDDGKEGFFCDKSEEWSQKLSLLLKDSSLRTMMGKLGRIKVQERYSVSSNRENFLDLFS